MKEAGTKMRHPRICKTPEKALYFSVNGGAPMPRSGADAKIFHLDF